MVCALTGVLPPSLTGVLPLSLTGVLPLSLTGVLPLSLTGAGGVLFFVVVSSPQGWVAAIDLLFIIKSSRNEGDAPHYKAGRSAFNCWQ